MSRASVMEDSAMEPALPRKEQEFIDHTLLAPTYIRDSNNFIIDLMEHPTQIVFPKTVVHVSPGTPVTSASSTDALPPDLQFHNAIFHFRQVQPEVGGVGVGVSVGTSTVALSALAVSDAQPVPPPLVGSVSSTSNNDGNAFKHTHTPDFMTLNGDFLGTNHQKSYCAAAVENQAGAEAVQQFLLAPPNVSLDESNVLHDGSDVMYARSNARKVLPHKKRISRKLRVSQSCDEDALPPPLIGQKLQEETEERLGVGTLSFSCEICGHTAMTQLQFFEHLKQHYEPSTPDTILAAMKTTLDVLQPNKSCENLCELSKKASDSNVNQVFNDVHLNDFHSVDETVQHVMDGGSQDNDMKILKDITPDEVEFSDTEDMLEGIRNVVDKVSIEDTYDIDLMGSNVIRAPWFPSNNFSNIIFKSKPFGDVTFSDPLTHLHTIDENIVNAESKAQQATTQEHFSNDKAALNVSTVDEECFNRDENCVNSVEAANVASDAAVSNEPISVQATASSDNFSPPISAGAYSGECVEDTVDTPSDADVCPDSDDFEPATEGDDGAGADADADADAEDNYLPDATVKNGKKQYVCTKCYRKFNSSNALKYHNRTHSGVRPHQCDICGKSFFAQGALKSHMRTHTGDKPFQCEHCQRHFRQWGDLKYHTISIHTAEKSHQCEFCGKAFSRKYSLVLHRRIHTSERNYECEFCAKTFRASTYLQNHRKIHTGEKPHECEVCSKRFRVSGDLRRHLRIHQRQTTKTPEPAGDGRHKD